MAKQEGRELLDIETNEVSLVGKPANKKSFLFVKQKKAKINIEIGSDGTVGGTKIAVNGDILQDLKSFNFSIWNADEKKNSVDCSYNTLVDTNDGFKRSETFYLCKSKGASTMGKKIMKALREYLGLDAADEIQINKSDLSEEAVAKAIDKVAEYQGDFPKDLKTSVALLVKSAAMLTAKKESADDDKVDLEKKGAKFSSETLSSINKAIDALKSILPAIKDSIGKSNDGGEKLQKDLENPTKAVESLNKVKKSDDETAAKESTEQLKKQLEDVTSRLATVEEQTGVQKGIQGQDGDDDEVIVKDDKPDKKVDDPFPSIRLLDVE